MNREYPERPVASAAAVILRENEVVLIRRGFPPRQGIWTFPGGAIEAGETAREACAREILEETGLTIQVGPVIEAVDVMQQVASRWRYHYTILDFLAEVHPESGELCAGSDACDARWVPVGDVLQYDLTPVAQHVLERGIWLRENGCGPCLEHGAYTIIGEEAQG